MWKCLIPMGLILLGQYVKVLGQPTHVSAEFIMKLTKTLSSPIDMPLLPAVNQMCLKMFSEGLPIQALDAFGKPHSGILGQNFNWLGNYEECTAIDDFKHCVADMMISLPAEDSISSEDVNMPIFWGICMPNLCSEAEIDYLLLNMLDQMNVSVFKPNTQLVPVSWRQAPGVIHCNEATPFDTGFICVICVCSVLAVLMLFGAAMDIYLQWIEHQNKNFEKLKAKSEERVPLVNGKTSISYTNPEDLNDSPHRLKSWTKGFFIKLLLCFAVNKSLTKLLNTSPDKKAITCLNGIRVLSITWIILGHTFQAGMDLLLYENMPLIEDALKSLPFTVQTQAMLAVDSFFFMSGFLLAYLTLWKMAQRNGNVSWGNFYFHRFWRLTPAYAAVILFLIYIVPYMGSGPLWYRYQNQSNCVDYWWHNLLYINNFFSKDMMCMSWSWYLSVDVQCYIISPIILIALHRSPRMGCFLLSFLMLLSICLKGGLSVKYLRDATSYADFFTGGWYEGVYNKPYTRIIPYLVGFALGFAMIKRPRIRIPAVVVAAGWFLCFILGLVIVYVINDFQNHTWTPAGKGTYEALCSFTWAICLTWVVVACHNGYGGWINSFLSWSFWIPFGKLTYSTYLVQQIVIYIIVLSGTSSLRGPISVPMSAMYVSTVVLSFGVALIFALAIEYPCANLETLLLSPKEEKRNSNQPRKEQC